MSIVARFYFSLLDQRNTKSFLDQTFRNLFKFKFEVGFCTVCLLSGKQYLV